MLAAHARTLDSRLRVAAHSDRLATRRAAAHVVQLARRIARLLPRVPTLLPVLPDGGRDTRVRHYVLKAQPVAGTPGTRILTISTHSVLRYGEFDGSGKPVLWNEYDPLQPVVGWDLETVLERLAEVLGQITEHVESLEARVAERAKTLNSLLNSSPVTNRPLGVPAAAEAKPKVAASLPAAAAAVANETRKAAPQTTAPSTSTPAAAPPATKPPTRLTPIAAPVVIPQKTITYGPAATPTPPPVAEVPKRHAPSDDLLNVAASLPMDEARETLLEPIASNTSKPVSEPMSESVAEPMAEVPEEFDDSMPELALIDLAFGALPADYDVPDAPAEPDEPAEMTDVFPALDNSALPANSSANVPVNVPVSVPANAPVAPSSADATAEREKRERRLFQHLRVR